MLYLFSSEKLLPDENTIFKFKNGEHKLEFVDTFLVKFEENKWFIDHIFIPPRSLNQNENKKKNKTCCDNDSDQSEDKDEDNDKDIRSTIIINNDVCPCKNDSESSESDNCDENDDDRMMDNNRNASDDSMMHFMDRVTTEIHIDPQSNSNVDDCEICEDTQLNVPHNTPQLTPQITERHIPNGNNDNETGLNE